jgi:hypothetical protein
MSTLVDTGGRARLEALFSKLAERIPEEALRPAAMVLAAEIAARAPSPEQEFDTMMYGGFNLSGASTESKLPGAATGEDNRVRFIKPPENYLRNYLPTSFGVNGLYAGIGNLAMLDVISSYTYVNTSKGQTYEHVVTEPFWWAWEVGGIFTIRPHPYGNPRGRGYPLRPTADSFTWEMQKSIPAMGMFTGVDIAAVVDSTLIPSIKKIISSL